MSERAGETWRRARPARGVTLIEALAALALLAAVAPVLARAWTVALDSAARARAEIVAATLAENKLAEIIAVGDYTQLQESGEFSSPYEGYRWKVALYDWPEDNRLQELDVLVEWTRKDLIYSTIVSTLVEATEQ